MTEKIQPKPLPQTDNSFIKRLTQQEQINFLLTNRIPRRWATLFMGWFSKIRNPLIREASLRAWKLFADDLNLDEAKKEKFDSLHDCFIRELKPGSREIDNRENAIVSPSDGIVGEFGRIQNGQLFQAKGFPYSLNDLLPDSELAERYKNGIYITLRLQSTMYHRFHAPCDGEVNEVTYISGDTWNVNPIALKRVEKLYCKNERAVIDIKQNNDDFAITLVPVAAILVASIKLHCLDETLDIQYKGPNLIPCDANVKKGDEMGYFQHGSTIILFAKGDLELAENLKTGDKVQMGQALLLKK